MLWVAEDGVQILERDAVCWFIEDCFERNATRVALSVVIVIFLVPLDDEPAVGCLPDHLIIDIPACEEVVPKRRDLRRPQRHGLIWNRCVLEIAIAGLRPVE